MKGQYVDDNGTKKKESDISCLGDGDGNTTEDLENLDEAEIAGWPYCTKKQIRRRSFGRFRDFEKMQKVIKTEDDEGEAEQAACDIG